MRVAPFLILAACGSDRAPVEPIDAPSDAVIFPDTPTPPPGCDWAELDDPINDITLGNGAAEQTQLTLGAALVVCGEIDNGHLIGEAVDVDAFVVTLAARTTVRVDYAGAITGLAALDIAVVDAGDAVVEHGTFLGTHAAFQTTLAAGAYRLVVTANNPTDLAAALPYKLRITANPAGCTQVAAAASYTENNDGPQSDRNDVIDIRYATNERTFTAANNDDPEPTTLVTVAGTGVRITGLSDAVDAADDFKDRDTYLIETGAHDDLAVRIDWTGDADFDFFVFPENTLTEIARGTGVGKTGPEQASFPVLANTRYWLWIGSYDSSAGLPVTYDVSLCPTTFVP